MTLKVLKLQVASFILNLPPVRWAHSITEETVIQIFEGDGETAKSWHLKNRCHDHYSQPQSSQNSISN